MRRIVHQDRQAARRSLHHREAERLEGAEARLAASPEAIDFEHQHHGYVARGRYAEQLERWFDAFPREQVLVVFSDDLENKPVETMAEVQEFLGLPPIAPDVAGRWNKQHNSSLDPVLEARYGLRVPVLRDAASGEELDWPFAAEAVRAWLA